MLQNQNLVPNAPVLEEKDQSHMQFNIVPRTVYTDAILTDKQLAEVNLLVRNDLDQQPFHYKMPKQSCGHACMRFVRYQVHQQMFDDIIRNFDVIVDISGDISRSQAYIDECKYNPTIIYTRPIITDKDVQKIRNYQNQNVQYCTHDLEALNTPNCTCDLSAYYFGNKLRVCILMFDNMYYYTPDRIHNFLLRLNSDMYDVKIWCATIKMLTKSGSYFNEYSWIRNGSYVNVLLDQNIEGYGHLNADWLMNPNWIHSKGEINYRTWFSSYKIASVQTMYHPIYNVSEVSLVDKLTISNIFKGPAFRYDGTYSNLPKWQNSYCHYVSTDGVDIHVFTKNVYSWFFFTGWRHHIIPLQFVLDLAKKTNITTMNAIATARNNSMASELFSKWENEGKQTEIDWKWLAPELVRTMNLPEKASFINNSIYSVQNYTVLLSSLLLDHKSAVDSMNWRQLIASILILIIIYPIIAISIFIHKNLTPFISDTNSKIQATISSRRILLSQQDQIDDGVQVITIVVAIFVLVAFLYIVTWILVIKKKKNIIQPLNQVKPIFGRCLGTDEHLTHNLKFAAKPEIPLTKYCDVEKVKGTIVHHCLNQNIPCYYLPNSCEHNMLLSIEYRNSKNYHNPSEGNWTLFHNFVMNYWQHHFRWGREYTKNEVLDSIRKTSAKLSYRKGYKQNQVIAKTILQPHVHVEAGMFVKNEFLNQKKGESDHGKCLCKVPRMIIAASSASNETIMGIIKMMMDAIKTIASGVAGLKETEHVTVLADPNLLYTAGMSRDEVGAVFHSLRKTFNYVMEGDHTALDSHVLPLMLDTMNQVYRQTLTKVDLETPKEVVLSALDKQTVLKATQVGGKDIIVGASDHMVDLSQEGCRGSGQSNTSTDNTNLCLMLIKYIMTVLTAVPENPTKKFMEDEFPKILATHFTKITPVKDALVKRWFCMGNGDNSATFVHTNKPRLVAKIMQDMKTAFGFDWKASIKSIDEPIEYCSGMFMPINVKQKMVDVDGTITYTLAKESATVQPNLGRVLCKWGETTKIITQQEAKRFIYEVSYVHAHDYSYIPFVKNYFDKLMKKNNYLLDKKRNIKKRKTEPEIDFNDLKYFEVDPEYTFTRNPNIVYEINDDTKQWLMQRYQIDIIDDKDLFDFFDSYVDHDFDYCRRQYPAAYDKIVSILEIDCGGFTDEEVLKAKEPNQVAIVNPRSYTIIAQPEEYEAICFGEIQVKRCHPIMAGDTDIIMLFVDEKPCGSITIQFEKNFRNVTTEWKKHGKPKYYKMTDLAYNKTIHILSLNAKDDLEQCLHHFFLSMEKDDNQTFTVVPYRTDNDIVPLVRKMCVIKKYSKNFITVAFEDANTWISLQKHLSQEKLVYFNRFNKSRVLNNELNKNVVKVIKTMYPCVVTSKIGYNRLAFDSESEMQDISTYNPNTSSRKTYCFDHTFDLLNEIAMHMFIIIVDCKYEPGTKLYENYYWKKDLKQIPKTKSANWRILEKFYSKFCSFECGEQKVLIYYNRTHYYDFRKTNSIEREVRNLVNTIVQDFSTLEYGTVYDNQIDQYVGVDKNKQQNNFFDSIDLSFLKEKQNNRNIIENINDLSQIDIEQMNYNNQNDIDLPERFYNNSSFLLNNNNFQQKEYNNATDMIN